MSRPLPYLLLCALVLGGCEEDGALLPSRSRSLDDLPAARLALSDDGWAPIQPEAEAPAVDLMPRLRCAGALLERERGAELVAERTLPEEGHFALDIPAAPAPGRRGFLEFEYLSAAGGILRLGRRTTEDQPVASALSARVEAGQWSRLRFALDDPRLAEDLSTRLCILPPAAELGEVRLRSLRLTPAETIHPSWRKLGEQRRRAWLMQPDTAMEWELRVSPGSELQFGFGNAERPMQSGDGTHFFVEMRAAGEDERILWSQTLLAQSHPGHRRWQDVRIPLPLEQEGKVRLRLGVLASPPRSEPFATMHSVAGDFPAISSPRIETGRDSRPNILLIVIDTLRADGFDASNMPLFFARRQEFAFFDRAYATGAWTHPSTGSIWSGRMPEEHGLGGSGASTGYFDPEIPLLPELLREAGYATAAASNNLIVSPSEGFARGIDSFDERALHDAAVHGAERLTRAGLDWLQSRSAGGPFFLYLHYFDPHDRYAPPEEYVGSFAEGVDWSALPSGIREGKVNGLLTQMIQAGKRTAFVPPPEQIAALWALYRAEILYADFWIDRLLSEMEASGQLANTAVVLTADHGEEFYEHGGFKHGHSLHEELLRIPLAIRFPDGMGAGTTLDTPASLLDLMPTLLAASGNGPSGLPGQDLRAWLAGTAPPNRSVGAVLFESEGAIRALPHPAAQALWRGQDKLLRSFPKATPRLFDLAEDPREANDLAASEPALRDELTALMDRLLGTQAPRNRSEGALDPAVVEKLRALGYVD